MLSKEVYLVAFEAPKGDQAKRIAFYRAVHKIVGEDQKFRSRTCYFTGDEEKARQLVEISKKFSKNSSLYKAEKIEPKSP